MHYGCGSPKRLQIRSNFKFIHGMDLGRLSRQQKEENTTMKTTSRGLKVWNSRRLRSEQEWKVVARQPALEGDSAAALYVHVA